MSCERHCQPYSIIKNLKDESTIPPGKIIEIAAHQARKKENENRQVDNQKKLKETEVLARNIVDELPLGMHFPVSQYDNESNSVKNYEIYTVDRNDTKIAYVSSLTKKTKWVNFTSFCIFTHIFKRDENGISIPDPEKILELFSSQPETRQVA